MSQDVPNGDLGTLLDKAPKTNRDHQDKLTPRQPIIFWGSKKINDRPKILPQGIPVPYGRR
jgi:hypothetical protein